MATFTMQTNKILEMLFGEIQYKEFEFAGVAYGKLPVIPDAKIIGLGTYPIFDEDYRPILNGKIVDEYFTREIGLETIDMWAHAMRRRMDQVMPFYNKLFKSEQIAFDPLITMDIHSVNKMTGTTKENVQSDNDNTSKTLSESRAVTSETPQTMLMGNGDYATGATDSNGETSVEANLKQTSNSDSVNENNADNHVSGMQGIASDLIMRYRESLLNIDTSIIKELNDCFMLMLNNGDNYTKQGFYY